MPNNGNLTINGVPVVQIDIQVDGSGNLEGGSPSGANDLVVYLDNDKSGTYNAGDTLLLSGSIDAFGTAGIITEYEFAPTGGSLEPTFNPPGQSNQIGIRLALFPTDSSIQSLDFTNGFAGYDPKGILGTIPGPQGGPTPGSVSGTVYCDTNLDGQLDNGENGEAGASVTLTGTDSSGNSVSLTTTSSSDGSYAFPGLASGTYTVSIATPSSGHLLEQSHGSVTISSSYTITLNASNPTSTGNNFAEIEKGALEGFVWDDTNCDGNIDWNEVGIQGVTVNLSGVDYLGNTVRATATTQDSGEYTFACLLPGTYTLKETDPTGFTECESCCGTMTGNQCGTSPDSDTITGINVAGCDNTGINFNFGDKDCTGETHGATATIGFWHNKNGQALLLSLNGGPNATNLGNWLATMFPNMYGANSKYDFAGWTNKQIASFYITNDFNVTGVKLNAQVLSVAFASYVTSSNLAGTGATSYGFKVTTTGTGYDLINVGSNGAAFGVANNTSISILQALEATNADASNGILYATSETVLGTTYSSSTLQSMANTVYSAINQNGDIT